MYIHIWIIYLSNKIAVGCNNLLQAAPDATAGMNNILPVEVNEYILDGSDEGFLCVSGGPISVPLSHAPYKKVQGIDIWAARRP